jgi:hypothetical protein
MANLCFRAVDGTYGLTAGNGDGPSCPLLPKSGMPQKAKTLTAEGIALVSLPNLVQIGDTKTHVCVFAGSES